MYMLHVPWAGVFFSTRSWNLLTEVCWYLWFGAKDWYAELVNQGLMWALYIYIYTHLSTVVQESNVGTSKYHIHM